MLMQMVAYNLGKPMTSRQFVKGTFKLVAVVGFPAARQPDSRNNILWLPQTFRTDHRPLIGVERHVVPLVMWSNYGEYRRLSIA